MDTRKHRAPGRNTRQGISLVELLDMFPDDAAAEVLNGRDADVALVPRRPGRVSRPIPSRQRPAGTGMGLWRRTLAVTFGREHTEGIHDEQRSGQGTGVGPREAQTHVHAARTPAAEPARPRGGRQRPVDKLEQLRTELSIVTDRRRGGAQNAAHPPERDTKVVSLIKAELLILAAEKDDHPDSAALAQQMLAGLDSEFGDPDPEPGAGLTLTERPGPGWQDDLEVLMPGRSIPREAQLHHTRERGGADPAQADEGNLTR